MGPEISGNPEAPTTSSAPSLNRANSSRTGTKAEFGTAEEEVARILRVQHHYYAVLKVSKSTEASEVRQNYLRLSRLVHPDKCRHPQSADASAVVNQAYDTLRTAVKKALYDRYVDDVEEAQNDLSYADWEAQNAANVNLPQWMQRMLRVPGGALCLFIIVFPVTLLLLLLLFLMVLVCLPFRLMAYCCCGYGRKPPQTGEEATEGPNEATPGSVYEPPPPIIPPVSPTYESPLTMSTGAVGRDPTPVPTPIATPTYEAPNPVTGTATGFSQAATAEEGKGGPVPLERKLSINIPSTPKGGAILQEVD